MRMMLAAGLLLTVAGCEKPAAPSAPGIENEPAAVWSLSRQEDRIRHGQYEIATLPSADRFTGKRDANAAFLQIHRDTDGSVNVAIVAPSDQGFSATCFSGCGLPLSIDGKQDAWTGGSTDSSRVILNHQDCAIEDIVKAKTLIVELPLARSGPRQYQFNSSGLPSAFHNVKVNCLR